MQIREILKENSSEVLERILKGREKKSNKKLDERGVEE